MYITEFQRRALLALMDVEAARVADGEQGAGRRTTGFLP